jgi:transposase-like protein
VSAITEDLDAEVMAWRTRPLAMKERSELNRNV